MSKPYAACVGDRTVRWLVLASEPCTVGVWLDELVDPFVTTVVQLMSEGLRHPACLLCFRDRSTATTVAAVAPTAAAAAATSVEADPSASQNPSASAQPPSASTFVSLTCASQSKARRSTVFVRDLGDVGTSSCSSVLFFYSSVLLFFCSSVLFFYSSVLFFCSSVLFFCFVLPCHLLCLTLSPPHRLFAACSSPSTPSGSKRKDCQRV
jgi:hypothetical protein